MKNPLLQKTLWTAGLAALSLLTSCSGEDSEPPETISHKRQALTYSPVIQIDTKAGNSCALLANNEARCWGTDLVYGSLGNDPNLVSQSVPVSVSTLTGLTAPAQIAAGDGGNTVCATDPSRRVFCWGSNLDGQLGTPAATLAFSPTPYLVAGATDVIKVEPGNRHVCALRQDGTVLCWGLPTNGLLGNGFVSSSTPMAPTIVAGLAGVIDIDAGDSHTCALLGDGTVKCWGVNQWGQIGVGTSGASGGPSAIYTPSLVLNLARPAIRVSAGGFHTCVILNDGTAACWGANDCGEIGNGAPMGACATLGSSVIVHQPARVVGPGGTGTLGDLQEISTGSKHSCAVRSDGRGFCWGTNATGAIGDGTSGAANIRTSPTQVIGLGTALSTISAGGLQSCGLLRNGGMCCWGGNSSGELGNNSLAPSPTPVDVQGLSGGCASNVCVNDNECLGGQYCAAGRCQPQLINGTSCGTGSQCLSGMCIDGVCCNSSCGGGNRDDCQACSKAAGATQDGQCGAAKSGTLCRAAVGICDITEVCDGASLLCPTDRLVTAGTQCRASMGECDDPESCTGLSPLCPMDKVKAAGFRCREASGDCDQGESCDGAGVACPADSFKSSDTECRPSAGICDIAEYCTGSAAQCPTDQLRPATYVCREASCTEGTQTLATTCSGDSASCAPPITSTCSPFVCGANACLTSCTMSSQCTAGYACSVNLCVRLPTADAGPDQTINEGTTVILNGSGSHSNPPGSPLTYQWAVLVGPPGLVLNLTDPIHPTFFAPAVPAGGTVITLQLIVKDGPHPSEADTVNITVKNLNNPPVTKAGTPQTVNSGTVVGLDGSASYDADGEPLTYLWQQVIVGTEPVVSLGAANSPMPYFTAPSVTLMAPQTLTFRLTTSDGIDSTSDTVTVTVERGNHPPVANAGPAQTVATSVLVQLDGTLSQDPDGDPLTYSWSQTSGSAVTLSDASAAAPTFTAPATAGNLTFQLVVRDPLLSSPPSQVTITVQANNIPVCTAARLGPSLWPPNHKLVKMAVLGVTAPGGAPVTISYGTVTQDEPINGLGDGDTAPDAVLSSGALYLRAERQGPPASNGRVYHVSFTATTSGGSCSGTLTTCVPHNQGSGPGSVCVDGGPLYNSFGP